MGAALFKLMAIDTAILDKHLKAVIADLPVTMIFGLQSVAVMVGDTDRNEEVQDVGYFDNRALRVTIAASDFSPAPDNNDKVTVGGEIFRVVNKIVSPSGVQVMYDLDRITG